MKSKLLIALGIAFSFGSSLHSQNCTTPVIAGGTICAGTTFSITNPNPGTLAFYGAGMNFLGLSTSYSSAPATTTVFSYVDNEFVGPTSNTIGTGGYYTTVAKVVTFSTFTNVIINTIDVYPQNAGTIVVSVKNSANVVTNTATVTVPAGGKQTLPLGFQIPTGTGYNMELISETCGGLYRNNAGNAFPYNSPSNLVSLTSTDYASLGYYYYFYNWNVSNAGCVNTLTVTVSQPTAAITASGSVLSTGSGFATYKWLLNNTAIAGATSQSYAATQSGVYTVSVTNQFGCSATSVYTLAINATGIAEANASSRILSVYPNPADGNSLTLTHNLNAVSALSIHNLNGQLIKMIAAENMNSAVPGTYTVNISDLENGIYFLRLVAENHSEYQKLIINR